MAHPLYSLSAWVHPTRGLRRRALDRDAWLCRMCGTPLTDWRRGQPAMPTDAQVDHITPHKGSRALFLDMGNLQSLCRRCHGSTKQADEARGYSTAVGDDGWPVDPKHPAWTTGG